MAAYAIPTEEPESDGTFEWSTTTLVVVHVHAGQEVGLGFSYASTGAAALVRDVLADLLKGRDAVDPEAAWVAMVGGMRGAGLPGAGAMAVSAVDVALWDLAARLRDIPLARALGIVRHHVPVYGSGGFTSYSRERLEEQLSGWAAAGMSAVKMKVGRDPSRDADRVAWGRKAVGDDVGLFVDANGAFQRQQALAFARSVEDLGVSWFEEPVSSDDLEGLRLVRDASPPGMEVTAGEYGWAPWYYRSMLAAGAVDVLQADVTRCGGFTGFAQIAALCQAHHLQLSSHGAPQLSVHAGAAGMSVRHAEYFHDHVRIERLLLDGHLEPVGGALSPDLAVAGHGLRFKAADAERYRVALR